MYSLYIIDETMRPLSEWYGATAQYLGQEENINNVKLLRVLQLMVLSYKKKHYFCSEQSK
ncbi:MAG: hypothetical protein EAZ57_11250 [Cytophagales bacterium]|nr:MAG: hypothetical protein EAZ67_12185 [Cytophagales bacterium]TAF59391.1 MAG: hypothetical protein EAZ57_11250 [Cytophagales bacterium]